MTLFAFAASHRSASYNRQMIRVVAKSLQAELLEYGTFDAPIYDDENFSLDRLPEGVKHFVKKLTTCSGMVIATPEYNWSYPGSLKNLIDWASRLRPNPFQGKTAFVLSASPSLRGGVMGAVHLKATLEALGVRVLPRVFTLSLAQNAFTAEGELADAKLVAELEQVTKEYARFSAALAA